MIRITKLSDYGTAIMAFLVKGDGSHHHTARSVALKLGLTVPMVSKILKMLVQKGLLVSMRGAKGGYYLASPPEQISLADIVQALDGPIAITSCSVPGRDPCLRSEYCPGPRFWPEVNLRIQQVLQSITLATMTAPDSSPLSLAM